MASVPFTFDKTVDTDNNAPYKIQYSGNWTIAGNDDRTQVTITGPLKIVIHRTGSDKASWDGSGGDYQLILFNQTLAAKSGVGNPNNTFRFPVSLCNVMSATAIDTNINITVPWNVAFGDAVIITFILWESGAPAVCGSPSHQGPVVSDGLILPSLPEPPEEPPEQPEEPPPEPKPCDTSDCWIGSNLISGSIASYLNACSDTLDTAEGAFR